MKKILLILSLVLALSACGEITEKQAQPTSSAQTASAPPNVPELYAKYFEVSQNANGVVIFDKPEQMFEAFNDYPVEGNHFEKTSGSPFNIRLSREAVKGAPEEIVQNETEMTLLYGVLKTFANTKENQLVITSIPIDEKGQLLKKYSISLTVNRDQVLSALGQLNLASSFDELVQTQPNEQFRQLGISGSSVYDNIVYKDNNRKQLIELLR